MTKIEYNSPYYNGWFILDWENYLPYLHADGIWRLSTEPYETGYYSTKEDAEAVLHRVRLGKNFFVMEIT